MLLAILPILQVPIGTPNDTVLRDFRESHLTSIRQLTSGGQNAEAYWNSTGTKIVYQSTQPEWPDEQIVIMNADGSGKKLISSGKGRCTCSYFVPGDKKVIFSATDWADPGPQAKADMSKGYVWMVNPNFRQFEVDLATGARKQIQVGQGYCAETTVDPNGKFMTFTSTRDGDLDIYRSRLDGSRLTRLTNEVGYDGGPFVSWDGKKIVYRRGTMATEADKNDYLGLLKQNLVRPSKLEIWIMDADGRNKRQVTHLSAASFAPFLHPDGETIIFSSNYGDPRGREFDLWAINVDGTRLRRITYANDFDGFPMFTRDGKKLVWASNRNGKVPGETNIFACDWKE